MKNVAWYALVLLVIHPAPTPTRTAEASTVVQMLHVKVVFVNVMVVSKLFSRVKIEIVFSIPAKKSPQLPPQLLLQLPQLLQRQLLQQLRLLLLNVFQTVIWIALVSVAWLSVTHLIVVVLVEVDLLLRVST